MKILAVHNYYQQWGGEDQVFEDEVALLRSKGNDVHCHTQHSDAVKNRHLFSVAVDTLWNRRAYRELLEVIREFSPDVLHVVNTFPLFSPAIFFAARKANVPAVAFIHNCRYFCAQGACFRNDKSCETCLGKVPWRAVKYGCYRGSRSGSAVVASMQLLHRSLQTWNRKVDVICVLSEFSMAKLAAAGIRGNRMIVRPNFVSTLPDPGTGQGRYAIYVGRLSEEKGIRTLVQGWRKLKDHGLDIPLKIVGDGPESHRIKELIAQCSSVEWLGMRQHSEVYKLVGDAACMVFPSECYESLPKTLIESLAVGTPVIGANIGSVPEIIADGLTGELFRPGDAQQLATVVSRWFSDLDRVGQMRSQCRQVFEERYTADKNYEQLLGIYREAIRRREHSPQ